jgi:hypothetical protein
MTAPTTVVIRCVTRSTLDPATVIMMTAMNTSGIVAVATPRSPGVPSQLLPVVVTAVAAAHTVFHEPKGEHQQPAKHDGPEQAPGQMPHQDEFPWTRGELTIRNGLGALGFRIPRPDRHHSNATIVLTSPFTSHPCRHSYHPQQTLSIRVDEHDTSC